MIYNGCMFGYMDESGAPGISNAPNDYLVVSLVLFANKDVTDKCSKSIDRLRKRTSLPDTYEFHYSRNNNRARDAMIKQMSNMDFKFITVAIRKSSARKLASYSNVAELIVTELARQTKNAVVLLDSNPVLCSKLKKQVKTSGLQGIKFKQAKSRSDNLIQLADYVTAICTKRAKNPRKSFPVFNSISKKQLAFLDITA